MAGTDQEASRVSRPAWPLAVVAVLWAGMTQALLGIVAVLALAIERVAGKGVVGKSLVLSVALEAIVYLAVSFGVFRMARLFGSRRFFWLAGPLGYLVGLGGYALLAMSTGADAGPVAPLAAIVADTVACAVGAFLGARGSARGDESDTSEAQEA